MSHYNRLFLQELNSAVNLPALIAQEVKLKKNSRNYTGCCPFHDEKTPSFSISIEKNTFHCYGCGVKGDSIQWLIKYHHLSFQEAVIRLAQMTGKLLPVNETYHTEEQQRHRKQLALSYQLLKEASRIYRYGLTKSREISHYLKQRKISQESINKFELGAVAKGIISLLNEVPPSALIAAGLAGKNDNGSLYDRFRHRLMFPIHNDVGTIIGFAGRTIEKRASSPKYLNSPESDVFQKRNHLYGLYQAKSAIRRDRLAILVEGYMDVISLVQAGEGRAVGSMGTALTNEQMKKILKYADTIIFAYDSDHAGHKAALSATAILLDEITDKQTAKFIFLPKDQDPDSFIHENGIDEWNMKIENAMPLSNYLIKYVTSNIDITTPEGKVKAAEKAVSIIKRIRYAEFFKRALQCKFEELFGFNLNFALLDVNEVNNGN